MSKMNYEAVNARNKLNRDATRQVPFSSYKVACETRWSDTARFLPVDDYTEVLALAWKERLPANKVIRVIKHVETNWDHEDEECPHIALDVVSENLETLKQKKVWREVVRHV